MPKTQKNVPIKPHVEKHAINSEDLSSSAFSFDEQMLYEPISKWNDFKHWVADRQAGTYKWYNSHPITIYALKRILYGLITLIVAVSVIALLVHWQTDESIFNPENVDHLGLSDEQLQRLREARMEEFGYSKNIFVFWGQFLYNLIPFIPKTIIVSQTWGVAIENGEIVPVLREQVTQTVFVYLGKTVRANTAPVGTGVVEVFAAAIPHSFAFGSLGVLVSFLIGIPLGIEAAKRKGKVGDNTINGTSLFLGSVPALITTLTIFLIAVAGLGLSSTYARGAFSTRIFPFITLLFFWTPNIVILTRRYVIDEMTMDYTRFAFSQGFSTNKVFYVYIFRNAGIKILHDFPTKFFATLFGASMLVETQWGIPGMSGIVVKATSGSTDPFVLLGYVSFTAFVQIFSSLIADLLLVGLDPRVSLGRK